MTPQPGAVSAGHPRLAVAAAALAVLGVLVIPVVAGTLLDLTVPRPDRFPGPSITERAQRVAELPGTNVLGGTVVLTLTPEMQAPAMRPSRLVVPSESAGQLVPVGVSGLVPMAAEFAPAGTGSLMSGLWPSDQVFANLGPVVVSCLVDPPRADGECTPTLLTQHSTGYYRYPASWGGADFLGDGSRMQAMLVEGLNADLVIGGLPGTDVDRVIVRLADGSAVVAFTTDSASPGDTVWWASAQGLPVSARAYDADGNELDDVRIGD
ncbi:MAG: hypothetical protein WBQ50_13805 [Nocardioides sp.]